MLGNVTLMEYLGGGRAVAGHRPWPRYSLDERGWREMVHQLSVSDWTLLGLWADGTEVHAALRDEENAAIAVASVGCPDRRYPSLSGVRPAAIRLERAIHDLYGLTAEGLEDQRPWLDHGRWGQSAPLAIVRGAPPSGPVVYPFLPVEGESLHQIPVGPVHAGVIEPGHFRFTCAGETVVRLEERLGYTHKGVEGHMAGKSLIDAARLAGRISGDSTVAYAIAFARAAEAATGTEAPPRAHWMRALMAELERVANHILDFGAICNDAAFSFMLAQCTVLRERILSVNELCFGHRLLMDTVIPGGVAVDVTREGSSILRGLVKELRKRVRRLADVYDDMPSLQDRTVGTGIVQSSLAHRFGAGGFVGRAASQGGDARKVPGYPPYDDLDFEVPVHPEGDVNARIWQRLEEVTASLALIEQILERMPGGPLHKPIPTRGGEGMALVEGFRGEILLWLRLSEVGRVVRCHPRDPSWFQWPLLEAAIEGNIVADFPLCNKSFNCSYSGVDL
ncbi:NADH-quinone oxidoreductase subunit C [Telmatospirillum siberiense]|uniref:Hydrogenase expression protein HypE n=1 Tax=Telmatospirillum siberiense TaxID=382514 RepID=A0A2N3Q0H7_9PROT|nr:NADH-quinone oxidoreductase subunit C [Telmatospirillum siberiense]PKU26168.1 hydrogenase expression protein HypE [Telmatospirillum siberiense]